MRFNYVFLFLRNTSAILASLVQELARRLNKRDRYDCCEQYHHAANCY